MSNYQRSDEKMMISDTYIAMTQISESVQALSEKITKLSEDIDTLTRSLDIFNSKMSEYKKSLIEENVQLTITYTEKMIRELQARIAELFDLLSHQQKPIKRRFWRVFRK